MVSCESELHEDQCRTGKERSRFHILSLPETDQSPERERYYGVWNLLSAIPGDEELYIYTRTLGTEQWLIVCNFHEKTRSFRCKQSGQVLLSNYKDTPALDKMTELRPYEAVIYRIERKDVSREVHAQDHSSDFEFDIELE